MNKKQYNSPLVEVMTLSAQLLNGAHAFGDASQPAQMGLAPVRRVPALGNDSVRVF